MKKIVALFLSIFLVATMMVGFSVSSLAEGETVSNYVTLTATESDPYATFLFANGAKINPDTDKYVSIKYRSTAGASIQGTEYVGQIYISPAKEPSVPVSYNFSGNWETTIVDCTKMFENATTDSVWNSANYTSTTKIRFDFLETMDRITGEKEILIQKGDSMDIAWIAVFSSIEDAQNYTGVETTPSAVVDFDSLQNPYSMTHCKLKITSGGEEKENPFDADKLVNLYSGKISTGYWFHNVEEGLEGTVYFTSDIWFDAINFFAFCSENNVNMTVELYRGIKEIYSADIITRSNNENNIDLGKKCQPGDYTLTFIVGDNSELDGWHFVLGSAELSENDETYALTVSGAWNTNESTLPGAAIGLYQCEAGELETPTPTPEATPTPAPATATPAAATEAPATEAPAEKSGCGSVVTGAFAIIASMTAGIIVFKRKED